MFEDRKIGLIRETKTVPSENVCVGGIGLEEAETGGSLPIEAAKGRPPLGLRLRRGRSLGRVAEGGAGVGSEGDGRAFSLSRRDVTLLSSSRISCMECERSAEGVGCSDWPTELT